MFFGIFFVGCEPGNQLQQYEENQQMQEEGPFSFIPGFLGDYATSEEGIADLDNRIMNLNQDIQKIEKTIDEQAATELQEAWMALDRNRVVLNTEIERFNIALEEGAELEAIEIRARINVLLAELEDDVENFQRLLF
ncbi:MAG: hypothetical protein H0X62_05415 [Bacteroidetes bacterium]|nr:hypothetical protein [Bacteroidota bacterium]